MPVMVRRWVRNLARQPVASESDLLAAIAAGECDYGIASRRGEHEGATFSPVRPRLFTVTAMGVGRHAENPEGGQGLVDWMLRRKVIADVPTDEDLPVPAHTLGWHDEDVKLLAERAAYR